MTKRSSERKEKMRLGELCSTCGSHPPRPERRTCQRCADLIKSWRIRNATQHKEVVKKEHQKNKARYLERSKEWFAADPSRQINKRIKRTIGLGQLSIEVYEQMLKEQNHQCAICGSSPNGKRLVIDHDHDSGHLRGLLCEKCNLGLGLFRDNIFILELAAQYLKDTKALPQAPAQGQAA